MIKFPVTVVFLGLMLTIACAVPATDEVSGSEKKVFQETLQVADGVLTNAVTPLKSIFLRRMAQVQCWICSSPCNAYYCCNDGWPQCCLVGGRCMCCRS